MSKTTKKPKTSAKKSAKKSAAKKTSTKKNAAKKTTKRIYTKRASATTKTIEWSSKADNRTVCLSDFTVEQCEGIASTRVTETFERARRLEADAASVIGDVVRLAFGLGGTATEADIELLERASNATSMRGDSVSVLCDAARGRLKLDKGDEPLNVREISALSGRSRPSVTSALGSKPTRNQAAKFFASTGFIAPKQPADAPQGPASASDDRIYYVDAPLGADIQRTTAEGVVGHEGTAST